MAKLHKSWEEVKHFLLTDYSVSMTHTVVKFVAHIGLWQGTEYESTISNMSSALNPDWIISEFIAEVIPEVLLQTSWLMSKIQKRIRKWIRRSCIFELIYRIISKLVSEMGSLHNWQRDLSWIALILFHPETWCVKLKIDQEMVILIGCLSLFRCYFNE